MTNTRLKKRLTLWAASKSSRSCKNWTFSVAEILIVNDTCMPTYADIERPFPSSVSFVNSVESKLFEIFLALWYGRINHEIGPSGRVRNKLRVYKLIKTNFVTERYCEMMLPQSHRSAFTKFRCGVAPIRIETGWYERLAEDLRICSFCNLVENEIHVLLHCHLHEDLREKTF